MLTTGMHRHGAHLRGVATDNALSSASNFLASLIAVRAGGIDGFAAAGISLVLVRLGVAISRSYAVEAPVTLDPDRRAVTRDEAVGTAWAATVSGAAMAVVAFGFLRVADVELDLGLVILLSVGLVTMCQGEALRSLLVLRRSYTWALAYDGLWLLLLLAAAPTMLGWADPGAVLAVWAATGALAMAVTLPMLGRSLAPAADTPPALTPRLRAGLAAETAVDRSSNQLSIAVIASAANPALATGITAARTVLSPINPLLFAMFNFLLPVSAGAGDRRRRQALVGLMVGAPLAVAAVSLVVVALPSGWVEAVVGPAWRNARPVFFSVALLFAAAVVRQLVLAIARGASLVREARGSRYAASAVTFAPCLLAIGGRHALLALHLVSVAALASSLAVGTRVAAALRDREVLSC